MQPDVSVQTPFIKEKTSTLQIVHRNLLTLLVVFAVAHVPVYLLSLFLGQKGLTLGGIEPTASDSAVQAAVSGAIPRLAAELALAFKVLCCAFVSENAVAGTAVTLGGVLRHGISKFGKALLTMLPIILVEMLMWGLGYWIAEDNPCLALLILIPILFLTLFEFLLATAVSLRGVDGWKAYVYGWNLSKKNWWRLISVYIISIISVAVFVCIIYLPIFLIFRPDPGKLPAFSSIFGDFFYLWVIIEMVLLFLDIEKTRAAPMATKTDVEGRQTIESQ